MERKESSSSYRELWSAVLPIFSNNSGSSGTGMNSKKQILNISSKPSMLSSRSSLSWVIDRSCSQPLLSVWVSLLAKLHNHILDDVGVQIHADFLHIWPNILDDVTSSTSVIVELKNNRVSGSSKLNSKHIRDFLFSLLERATKITRGGEMFIWLRCLGDVHLASGSPSLAMKCYIEYLAMCTDFFERSNAPHWEDSKLFKRMIKCCEMLGCFTQAVVLSQFLSPEVDYSVAFGMAIEKTTNDASDSLYGFIWDLTILEFLINLHTKRNEMAKRQQAVKVMGLLELNSNNNEEIQREAISLRRSQFMRTLAKHYIFV
ncbi:integrator complex subunit 8 [Folsomia candida]|nr:integrator complex subunit 8 [Folsomia candida]